MPTSSGVLFARGEVSKTGEKMAEAKDISVNQALVNASQPVTAKTGEVSEAELERVVGGEISDFSFDVEQNTNIGSQSSGVGAGKVTFNPYSITKNS
jgi:tellurite resistance protein